VGYSPQGSAPVVLLRELTQHIRHGERVALMGRMARQDHAAASVAGMLPPLSGRARLGANVRLGYMTQ